MRARHHLLERFIHAARQSRFQGAQNAAGPFNGIKSDPHTHQPTAQSLTTRSDRAHASSPLGPAMVSRRTRNVGAASAALAPAMMPISRLNHPASLLPVYASPSQCVFCLRCYRSSTRCDAQQPRPFHRRRGNFHRCAALPLRTGIVNRFNLPGGRRCRVQFEFVDRAREVVPFRDSRHPWFCIAASQAWTWEAMRKLRYLVRVNRDAGSDWGASVPDLPGCVATGKTLSSPGCPLTVTRPSFVGCLNWRWLPRVTTRYRPSRSSIRMTSLTFTAPFWHSE